MNKKMNSNSMEHVPKQHFSINSRMGSRPSKVILRILRSESRDRDSFELSLSTCVFCRRIFNLEMQNFSLENQHMMNVGQPFSWRMTSTKVSNSGFLPTTWVVAHLTIVAEGGMGDLV